MQETSDRLTFVLDQDDDMVLSAMAKEQAQIVVQWRRKWVSQVFPDMVGRTKWRSSHRNIRVGDLGHVRYEAKVGQDDWRLARVVKAAEDDNGKVRTITVQFQPRHVKDIPKPYRKKVPVEMTIGVQRFAVLLPAEEQAEGNVTLCDLQKDQVPEASEMMLN